MTRRLKRIADIQPKWWSRLGYLLLMLAIVVIGLFADANWPLTLIIALPSGYLAAGALARAEWLLEQRAERERMLSVWERDLGV